MLPITLRPLTMRQSGLLVPTARLVGASKYSSINLLPTGLVAYYGFDEGAGSIVHDLSGNGNDGTWQGTLGSQWGPGIIDGGGVFNGTDNCVLTPSNAGLSGSLSFSMWVYPTVVTGPHELICLGYSGAGSRDTLYVQVGSGTINAFGFRSGAFENPISSDMGCSANDWFHIVFTYNNVSGLWTLYVNATNSRSATNTGAFPATANHIAIGTFIDIAGAYLNWFSGTIDEVGIWSRDLSAAEVLSLYNGGAGLRPF